MILAACAAPATPAAVEAIAATAVPAATAAPAATAVPVPTAVPTEVPLVGQVIESYGKDNYATVAEWEQASGRTLTLTESPYMAELVAAGKIPPLKDRLPEQVNVFLPHTEEKKVGGYGGSALYMSSVGGLYGGTNEFTGGFVMEHTYTQGLHPNIYLSYEPEKGGQVWVMKLRKGLKWSDGVPFTTEDVQFWYEDIVLNPELSPNLMDQMRAPSGKPVGVEIVDEYTFKFVFEGPFVIDEHVHMLGLDPCWHPKHFLKQFHPNYVDKATLDKMVADAKMESWMQLFTDRMENDGYTGTGMKGGPTLAPWVAIQGAPEKIYIYKPNPFYHAVDAVGQQLPYSDLIVEKAEDPEVAKLKTVEAELDFAMFGLDMFPIAKAKENEGKIKVARWGHSATNGGLFEFNLTTTDPVLRPLFRDKNFRFGVSYAMDRKTVIKLNWFDVLTPQQSAWSKLSPFYDEKLMNMAIEFDPAKAASFLDAAGLDKKDKDGWRLRSDGKRLELFAMTREGAHEKDLGIYIDNFKAVGLNMAAKVMDWAAIQTARTANELTLVYDAYNWGTNEGSYYQAQSIGVPYGRGFWCFLWNEWFTSGGKKGEEPIPEILEVIEAYNAFNSTIVPEERKAAMKIITTIAAENLWTIGSFNHPGYAVVYSAKLQNVPTAPVAWRRGEFGRPQVWYKEA